MTMPAIQIFKSENPEAGIDVLVKEKLKGIWQIHSVIDNVITYNEDATWNVAKTLKDKKYDKVFILPNSFRSALIPFLAGIPRRTAVAGQLRSILINDRIKLSDKARDGHQSQEYMEIFGNAYSGKLPMPKIKTNQKSALDMLNALDKKDFIGQKIMAILPGAAYGPAKMWPSEYFVETAKKMREQYLVHRFIILGTKNEIDICKEVHSKLDNSINLAGKTSFEQLTSLLSITEITIANDSGGMHLATACGTKVIGIFGITDPYKTGPLGSNSAFLTNDDYPHSRDIPRVSEIATKCLRSITPDQVVEKAKELLC